MRGGRSASEDAAVKERRDLGVVGRREDRDAPGRVEDVDGAAANGSGGTRSGRERGQVWRVHTCNSDGRVNSTKPVRRAALAQGAAWDKPMRKTPRAAG